MISRLAPFCLVLLPTLALAQTADSTAVYPRSVGFDAPEDISTLLEYRLPDWTWYTWDATFDLAANGTDQESQSGSNLHSALGTTYQRTRETDPREWYLLAGLSGSASRVDIDRDPPASGSLDREFRAAASLGGGLTEYLVDWFGLTVGGQVTGSYLESKTERDSLPDALDLGRRFGGRAFGGVSFGRTRNVDPVLRAQRINERLVELGRPPLSPSELRQLADRIARQSGYVRVFDRSEKYFWASLLEEITGGQTLPARDLLYLLEVFDESYGVRRQGIQAFVGVEYQGNRYSGTRGPGSNDRYLAPSIRLSWYENLSLEHQLDAYATGAYWILGQGDREEYSRRVTAGIGDLWLLTDRWRWSNRLEGDFISRQLPGTGEWNDAKQAKLESSLVVFVEDRLSLDGTLQVEYSSRDLDLSGGFAERWDWGVSASLSYQIGQGIY